VPLPRLQRDRQVVPVTVNHGGNMQRILLVIPLLLSFPLLAAAQDTSAAPPEIEPLSTGYLLFLLVVTVAIFAGFWWYYSRPETKDHKSHPK